MSGYLLCLPLLLVFTHVGSAGHDDSHITFWQAWTLHQHGALLNYNGERIEQSSSLLQVLLTSLLARLSGIDTATSGYVASLGCALIAVLYCYHIARRLGMHPPWLPALLTSSAIYFSYWACSGMETALATLCALLFVDQCQRLQDAPPSTRPPWGAMLASLLLGMSRPEMVLVGPLWLAGMACISPRIRSSLGLLLLPFGLLLLWRYAYFGQWFPNPVYAKSRLQGLGPVLEQLRGGLDYVWRLGRDPYGALLSMAVAAGLFVGLRRSVLLHRQGAPAPMLPWLGWVLLYGAFVVASGGDWMKEGRFWVPLIPAALLVVASVCTAWQGKLRYLAMAILLGLQFMHAQAFLSRFNFGMHWQQQEAWARVFPYAGFFERSNREHLRDLPALAELEDWIPRLHARNPLRPVTLMSKQMGFVNYSLGVRHDGQFRVMDMAGLVENSLRDCPVLAQDGFDRQGLRLNYRKFFTRLPQASQHCGIEAPDIIYDLYGWGETSPLPEYLEDQGYHIVFHQTGRINMTPGADVTAQEIIAIHTRLLGETRPPTVNVDFNALQPR